MGPSFRNFRAKRLALPAAYALAALLVTALLLRLFRSPPATASAPMAPPGEWATAKPDQLAAIVEEVRKQLQLKEGRTPGKQEVLRLVQQRLNRQQLGLEIKDLERPPARRSGVSRQQLLRLPRPERRPAPRVLLRPHFAACRPGTEPLFLVVVDTRASEIAYRNAIRETWYSPAKSHTRYLHSRPHLWKVVFTTGAGKGDNLQREIQDESKDYGDILQFSFLDTPYAGTRKTIGALLELSGDPFFKKCPPRFVLKVSDDTFVNMPAFVHWLVAKFSAADLPDLYVGHSVHADRPDRNPARKTYVPQEAYPYDVLPDYNKNPAYLFSWRLVGRLAKEIGLVEPISVDDAYVGILMARLGVRPQFNDHFVMLEGPMDVCMHLRMFFISHLPPVEVLNVFERNSKGRHLQECKDVVPYNADKLDL